MTVFRSAYYKLYASGRVLVNVNCSFEAIRRPTWTFHRIFHSSGTLFKKQKTEESVDHSPYVSKSKYKAMKTVEVKKNMTVKELAAALDKSIDEMFEIMLYVKGSEKYTKPNQIIDNFDIVEEIFKKLRIRYKIAPNLKKEPENKFKKIEDVKRRKSSEYLDVRPRPPVITIMGHVDHGKTTLLDSLRHSHIVDSEFGGITQHIGAFSVLINGKDRVTFLDTPGHAAFCSMRNRGAQCTDIVVLVIAADDGVMEQTIESINMAKEANVPIIVAINKIDKPQADIEAVKKMLMIHGLQVEDLGGDIQTVPISALKGTNIDALMDAILVQAELMELKSDYEGPVEGIVIESTTDSLRGKLCTLLVQVGTLKKSKCLVAGTAWCKVRAMFNENGDPLQEATPSCPVQILGWRELPGAGELVIEVPSEKRATEVIEIRKEEEMLNKMKEDNAIIEEKMKQHYAEYRSKLELRRKLGLFRLKPEGPRKKEIEEDTGDPRLNIIIKCDVAGSAEAILDVLDTYNSKLCQLDVVHYGVGPVSKNDLILAESFKAIIYTFNIGVHEDIKKDYKQKAIVIKRYNIIYKLIDDLKSEMNKRLPLKDVEEIIGEANVLQEFVITEGKTKVPVAGCRCTKGNLKKSAHFRVVRSGETVFEGFADSLKHFKDEVDSIKKDVECGLKLADSSVNFKPGDTIICYIVNKVPQVIDWDPGF